MAKVGHPIQRETKVLLVHLAQHVPVAIQVLEGLLAHRHVSLGELLVPVGIHCVTRVRAGSAG